MEFILVMGVSILILFQKYVVIAGIVCRTTYFRSIIVNIECKFWNPKRGCY